MDAKMDLVVKENKTKYMLQTNKDVQLIDAQITADNYTLDTFDQTQDYSYQQVLL